MSIQVQDIFDCAAPHIKEAISGNIYDCPSRINSECSKTGECVCNGGKQNLEKLVLKCALEITEESGNLPNFILYSITSPNLYVENSDLSNYQKEIYIKYMDAISRTPNVIAFISISNKFENKIYDSALLSNVEKERIGKAVTRTKYLGFAVTNIDGVINPAEWPSACLNFAAGFIGGMAGGPLTAVAGILVMVGSAGGCQSYLGF